MSHAPLETPCGDEEHDLLSQIVWVQTLVLPFPSLRVPVCNGDNHSHYNIERDNTHIVG